MSENMKKKKTMSESVEAFQAFSDKEKTEWNNKAKENNDSATNESNKKDTKNIRKAHKKSGYNLYMSDCMKEKKMKMQDVPSWKTLDENIRKEWNDKAKSENNKQCSSKNRKNKNKKKLCYE